MADPWVAFSSGNPTIPGLGEGIVFPEKEDGEGVLQGCLFRNKCRVRDLFSEARVRKEPVFIRVFVGSKVGIERWLQLSGPASCSLWVEVNEVKNQPQDCENDFLTGQVKLAYRLRASAGCYINVLPDSIVALMAFQRIKPGAEASNRAILFSRWLVLMPANAFRHLLCMIEPGGVLAEFQIVLRQLVDSSNYLELAFRHLDISGCLSHYPFVLTFEGVDLLVLTRDLRWTLLRFDCLEGKLKISKGSGSSTQENPDVESIRGQDWQLWEEISMEKDARRIGTLGALVFNNFYIEGKGFVGGVSVQEYLDSLVNSWKEAGKKLKFMFSFPGVTVFELKSSNMFPSARLSAEEQTFLSGLLSEDITLRRRSLDALVELLLGGMGDAGAENPGAPGSSSFRGIVPSSRDSAINWCTFHEVTSEACFVSTKSSGSFTTQNPGWLKVLEWLDRGFFNKLLEETLLLSESGGRGTSRVVEAFLKVIEIVPGDAIARIRSFFMMNLKELVGEVVGSCSEAGERSELEIVGMKMDERSAENERLRQEEKSRKLVCLCNVLSQVVHESSIAAAVIADAGVFITLESFLDLVQLALFREVSEENILPGEVPERMPFSSRILGDSEAPGGGEMIETGLVSSSSPFASSRINSILQAQREEMMSLDQCSIRKTLQSRGFTRMLLKMILGRAGGSSSVRSLSLAPESIRARSSGGLKAARARKLMRSLPSKTLLANASAAKCHLLSATAAMLTTKSSSLKRIRSELVQKLNEQQRRQLVGSFVEELMSSSSDGFPEKSHEHIIQILFILDKSEESIAEELQVKPARTRFPVLLLSEVQVRLKSTSKESLDHWITLGSLLQILSSFACKWPEGGSAAMVFERCGEEVEAVLRLLSSARDPALWGGGELLVMQTILRLLATAMQGVHHQPELDDHLWRILAESNWDFIRSYSQWVVFEACHECVWELLEDSLWSIWEPLEAPEGSFSSWLPRWLPSMQCEEIPLINLVSFLRLMIGLIERRLRRREEDRLLPGKARVLLEFLMNPVTGLLVKLLKGSGFCRKRMISQREFAAAYLFHPKHIREDLRGLIPYCTQREGIRSSGAETSGLVSCCLRRTNEAGLGSFAEDRREADEVSRGEAGAGLSFNLSYLSATNLEIASLQLLASIFSLSFHTQGVLPRRNPFLSRSYSYPFLDFHFLRLRHLYYVNLFRGQKLRLGKVSETSEWYPDEQVPFSEAEIRDEQLSLECAVHVQVLLALARNQTEEVTLRFKQLRVMDFLVHQIALEYEASQVATPRDVVRINKALAAQLRNSAKSEGSHGDSSLVSSAITTPSLAGLRKEVESSGKRHCSGHRRSSMEKRFQVLKKSIPKLELGFLSARNAEKLEGLESSACGSYLLSRPFTGRHEFLLKWQEVMKPFDLRPGKEELVPAEEHKVSFPDALLEDHPLKDSAMEDEGESKTKDKVVYSGKFFDLNEEVEKELAQDDDASESESSDEDSDESGDDPGAPGDESRGDDLFRPFVPKLNLPRSARKGDQEAAPPGGTEAKPEFPVESKSPGISLSVASTASWKRAESTTTYEMERSQRRLYRNPSLHLFLLELYITLMLTPYGTLDERYSDRFQTEKQKLNAPFFLFYHLNHVANSYLLPCLTEKMKAFHDSAYRILKLSWRGLFDSSAYKNRIRIAHGAFAQIYKATLNTEAGPKLVVLKTVDFPKGPYEPCKFFDIYSEVQIMEKFAGEPKVCQLLDYGVESESFVLVLKHYKCSLRAWRLAQGALFDKGAPLRKSSKSFFERLPVYLEVYAAVLEAVKVLERHNVVHYDLKCDNVLLEPNELVSEEEFWDPSWPPAEKSLNLPFKVCLADFGQSKASIFHGGECTFRNRGTEYVKSPEMLKLLQSGSDVSFSHGDTSVGKAVDVWGLGCLFYELLAAEFLLYDEDWMRFFVRVTTQTEELITEEKAEKIGNFAPVIEFIRFILVRDPCRRPSIDEVMSHLRRLQASLEKTKVKPRAETGVTMPVITKSPVRDEALPDEEPVKPLKPSRVMSPGLLSWLCCRCWSTREV